MTRDERARTAHHLHARGHNSNDIARTLGVTAACVLRYLKAPCPPRRHTPAAPDETWREHAACAGTPGPWDTDLEGRDNHNTRRLQAEQHRIAARICANCPVQERCRNYAITWWATRTPSKPHEGTAPARPYGVYGGWLFPDGRDDTPRPVRLDTEDVA